MHPYLTAQGRWLFASGVLFSMVGAVAGEPLLILAGQMPFVVLTAALLFMMPAARVLDRRVCRFRIQRPEAQREPGVMFLRRHGQERITIWLENHAEELLRLEILGAQTEGRLVAEIQRGEATLRGFWERAFDLRVSSRGIGRASLQGFDVLVKDRWGLLAIRDYMPCHQVFETYPSMTRREQLRMGRRQPKQSPSTYLVEVRSPAGVDLRELRDFQSGDPLRTVAWKATVRNRRLISREFDDERSRLEFLALDISSSMRAGTPRGEQFDHCLELIADLAGRFLDEGAEVGVLSFDSEIYGYLEVGRGPEHLRRIQRHLVGLNSVVSPSRTAMDDDSLEQFLADYLLVQERLDFRRGGPDVDRELLERWLRTVVEYERQFWESRSLKEGVLDDDAGLMRRFFQLRGVPLLAPAELRAGGKTEGLRGVLRRVLRSGRRGGRLTIVSDLVGLRGAEFLERSLHVVRKRGVEVQILVPLTPAFGEGVQGLHRESASEEVLRTLFARAEAKARYEVAGKFRSMGIEVRFFGAFPD